VEKSFIRKKGIVLSVGLIKNIVVGYVEGIPNLEETKMCITHQLRMKNFIFNVGIVVKYFK